MADVAALADIGDALTETAEEALERVLREDMLAFIDRVARGQTPELPSNHRQRIEAAFGDLVQSAASTMGQTILETLRKNETSFWERLRDTYLEQFGQSTISIISETTDRQLRELLLEGSREGQGVEEMARAMRDRIEGLSRYRAHVIARTETHSASQFASQHVAQSLNRPLVKEWNSVADYRTRDFIKPIDLFDHRSMNGVSVALEAPFRVPRRDGSFENMQYPGDKSGSIGNWIMCRCVQTYRPA